MSGLDMSDFNVSYNSDQPAQMQAHAFAQETDIHLGSGQKRTLYQAHHRAMALLTTHGKSHSEICSILLEEGYPPVIVSLVTTEQGFAGQPVEGGAEGQSSGSYLTWFAKELAWEIFKEI